ncbi:MAG: hypothetical protein QOI78_1974, partial [Actinomycetota bacterium]|nr:hypothetical protein [Actinomycetota bacterium]
MADVITRHSGLTAMSSLPWAVAGRRYAVEAIGAFFLV